MKKIMLIFGTRPEAIKMCPLVLELKERAEFRVVVCVTGQHRELLAVALEAFGVTPDYDLAIMRDGQRLTDITADILCSIDSILCHESPDIVLVHGDTSSAFAAALAAFYQHIPIGHVEAGLRTHDILSPFPEEFNRLAISLIASYHFAPTDNAKENLLSEGGRESRIFVTGNTVIDAMRSTIRNDYYHEAISEAENKRIILLTAHRRENIGENMHSIFSAVGRIAEEYENVLVIYPRHPNPKVKHIASKMLEGRKNVKICEPLDTFDFHNILARSYLVLTDSGGVQEEASALSVPTLVLREHTERIEGVEAGILRLVGVKENDIYAEASSLLDNSDLYLSLKNAKCPFGDGRAAEKIADILEKILK